MNEGLKGLKQLMSTECIALSELSEGLGDITNHLTRYTYHDKRSHLMITLFFKFNQLLTTWKEQFLYFFLFTVMM